MPARNKNPLVCWATLLLLVAPCHGFTSSSKHKASYSPTTLPYTITDTDTNPTTLQSNPNNNIQTKKPKWIPMELLELASSDHNISPSQFISQYTDMEAYTSCDDEGDDFHECDFFHQFLGPLKWFHLVPEAVEAEDVIQDVHWKIWKDVWSYPRGAVELADKVSKECLRYYKEFMLELRTTAKCPIDRPTIRVKVVPATYGLEGFEDAVWEATEDLMNYSSSSDHDHGHENKESTSSVEEEECCKAITFVVAAPDLFTDPSLMEGSSPQAEFEPDRFQEFTSTLLEKMVLFAKMEGEEGVSSSSLLLEDDIQLTPFHPLWKVGDELHGKSAGRSFPYPCVAVSAKIEV